MAIKDPFVNFFKKRRQAAEENIRKVKEFKQKFIAEPLQKIPQLVNEDLFKAKKKVKKAGEDYMKTTRKIQDFETKYFTNPILSAGKRFVTGGARALPFIGGEEAERKAFELGKKFGFRRSEEEFVSAYKPPTTTAEAVPEIT